MTAPADLPPVPTPGYRPAQWPCAAPYPTPEVFARHYHLIAEAARLRGEADRLCGEARALVPEWVLRLPTSYR